MTCSDPAAALLQALQQLMPDAFLSVIHEQPYCSLALTGTQLCLLAAVVGEDHHAVAAEYARILPDHEFAVGAQLVADIAVSAQVAGEYESSLVIDALLLDA